MSLAEELGFDFSSEPCERFPLGGYPCRKCLPCLQRRQKAWVTRLVEELRDHDYNYFVTLTYSPENVPADSDGQMMVRKDHLVKLNRDLRRRFQQGFFSFSDPDTGISSRFELPALEYKYYLTSEYGPSGGLPHYHGVFYNFPDDRYLVELLFRSVWRYGFISVFEAQEGAAGYVSKYLVTDGVGKKSYTDEFQTKPFALMSKGLGRSYVNRMLAWHQADPQHRGFYQYHGDKGVLDRYLKHKIFTEDQLQYFAELFQTRNSSRVSLYQHLRNSDPKKYEALMEERRQYFYNLEYSQSWKVLKKQSLK